MITLEGFKKVTGLKDDKLEANYDAFIETCEKYNINTCIRMSHFLAQIMHESINLTAVKENLNYSADALLRTFKKYFTAETAKAYARKPEKIGSRVYASRMGNGDEASGDGFKYRGRSYVQLTGKNNYTAFGKAVGVDFIKNPELLESPKYAMLAAGWFWNDRNLNALADKSGDNVTAVTKVINGGVNGLADRQRIYNLIQKNLS